MGENRGVRPPVVTGRNVLTGAVLGAVTYVLGYLVTYGLVVLDSDLGPDAFSSELFLEGGFVDSTLETVEPGTVEFTGWIFYNAHFVQTVWDSEAQEAGGENPALTQSSSVLSEASTQLPELLYHLVPVALLTAAGYLFARQIDATTLADAVGAGAMLAVGYLVSSVAGAVVFVTSGNVTLLDASFTVTVAPNLLLAVTLAGILIPSVFGTVGASLGSSTD